MIKREYLVKIQVKIRAWSKGDWGFPFIAGFMALLFAAAVLFASGLASLAEQIADGAYFALAAGVVLQLVSLSINKEKNQGVALDGAS